MTPCCITGHAKRALTGEPDGNLCITMYGVYMYVCVYVCVYVCMYVCMYSSYVQVYKI